MQTQEVTNNKVYDLIIVGAGAAGLFAGSLASGMQSLILEKGKRPGRKLLATGGGSCNLTNHGNIKDFISHYGQNGPKIRPILYKFNNIALMDFFKEKGLSLVIQADGKVFPKSLKSQDVMDVLLAECHKNQVDIKFSNNVEDISFNDGVYSIKTNQQVYFAKKIILAVGGSSFSGTGSDGSLLPILEKLGLKIINPKPALTPIFVEAYPYASLSGISIPQVSVNINTTKKQEQMGDLLFTHDCFSGPVVLNASRYVDPGSKISINYFPQLSLYQLEGEFFTMAKNSKQLLYTTFYNLLNKFKPTPKAFCDLVCQRINIDPRKNSSQTSKAELAKLLSHIFNDRFTISGTKGFKTAMATAGGVSLDEINIKTMESKKYPGMYFAGELLDVDGDTGGYNLQFAFSSAFIASKEI